ncbi:MAG: bifunctional transcriptional activator/DNA repair protein Ada [Deltaproteobacteria bacterium]|nr:bifunctional transcriptional activator/DNA repair protein Ada [Deltaproteobacteria bacterium]
MYRALVEKDPDFDGLFVTGVTTTGIFCRPTCTARKPRRDHVVFFATSRDALLAGYRPCRVCRPVESPAATPEPVRRLLAEVEADTSLRLKDQDLRERGLDPAALRRWFRRHHGMTFQGYQRALRLGAAFGRMKQGETATAAAFDHGWESLSGFADAFRKLLGAAPSRVVGSLVTVTRLETPLGPMLAGASDAGVCLLEFVDRRMIETQVRRLARRLGAALVPGVSPHLDGLAEEVRRYFAGDLRRFTVPLDLRGTPFQEQVWAALLTIPYGATRSYAEQARLIRAPSATRAVARANGDNRVAIVVPCHRVVGADGTLTGYGGGLWRKRFLLDLERRALASPAPGPARR